MANLAITRKLGARRPVSIKVTYDEGYDLSATTAKFWLDAPDGTPRVEGSTTGVTVEDITPVGATPQTVWKLTYAFDADDLTDLGRYRGEFEIDFGGGISEYYPIKKDVIQVSVVEHPASTA